MCRTVSLLLITFICTAQLSDAAFERIQLSARSIGIGGASVALTSGADSVSQNVAGLTVDLYDPELALSYLELYGLLHYNAIFAAIPILPNNRQESALGLHLTSSTDKSGAYQELEMGCAVGRQISSLTYLGFGFSYLTSQANLGIIQVGTGRGFSMDVGIQHRLANQKVVVGASIAHLLSYIDYDRKQIEGTKSRQYTEKLSPHIRLGGIMSLDLLFSQLHFPEYRFITPTLKKTVIALELAGRRFSLGLESEVQNGCLRFGYRYNGGLDQGVCAGFGYKFHQFKIDYSWANGHFGTSSHLVSITLRL